MASSPPVPQSIADRLSQHGQSHLVAYWDELTDSGRDRLTRQIQQIDFEQVAALVGSLVTGDHSTAIDANKAESPASVERLPKSEDDRARWVAAASAGNELLAAGKIAALVVAGGQGSRLGFEHPKGMFPIGPLSGKSLFQLHFEQLETLSATVGHRIPYFIMTSEATDAPTKAFLDENEFFGYSPHDVYLFQQGWLPAVDDDGRVLLAEKDRIATSPDGHGGMLRALHRSGLLEVMSDRGVEHIYYHQIDNPTAVLCDPVFLGLHAKYRSQMSTKVVAKVSAEEKMGVVVDLEGTTQIIEYSDLPDAKAAELNDEGSLKLWAGNTAIHCFERAFLDGLVADGAPGLPYHRAHKKVPHIAIDSGEAIEPEAPNAFKFEQFIFDAMPQAATALVMEVERSREFNPVKNAEGNDSPATAKDALRRLHHEWIEQAGSQIADGVTVEVSPRYAITAAQLEQRLGTGRHFTADEILEEPQPHEG